MSLLKVSRIISVSKSAGCDSIFSEHLRYASDNLSVFISICFTLCLKWGTVPSGMTGTILVPVVKSKSGNVTRRDNYRPITLACVVSKVLEYILIDLAGDTLNSDNRQFALKSDHGTETCIFVFKQVIEY